MKVGGGFFLWGIVIYMFFRRFGVGDPDVANSYRRGGSIPTAEIVGIDEFPLTYDAVTDAFERAEAPTEPTR